MTEIITVRIKKYSVLEACDRLAELTGHKRRYGRAYTRANLYVTLRKHREEVPLSTDLITEADLERLAAVVRSRGRPLKTLTNINNLW